MDKTELLKRTKRAIKFFVDDQGWSISAFCITNVEVSFGDKTKDIFDYEVEITLESPGILIGKGGRTIDALTRVLSEFLEGDVKIYIHESSLWKNLY